MIGWTKSGCMDRCAPERFYRRFHMHNNYFGINSSRRCWQCNKSKPGRRTNGIVQVYHAFMIKPIILCFYSDTLIIVTSQITEKPLGNWNGISESNKFLGPQNLVYYLTSLCCNTEFEIDIGIIIIISIINYI